MPPKEKLSREEILQAALALIRQRGAEALGARSLAAALGCSTMPLFRHFESMEELRAAAIGEGVKLYNDYVRAGLEDPIPFKGVGQAYIRFAREEPQLFRLFFMTPAGRFAGVPATDPNHDRVALAAAAASGTAGEESEWLFGEMWVFVHGIASLIVMGCNQFSDEKIGRMTSDVFQGLKLVAEKRSAEQGQEQKPKKEEREKRG